MPRRAAPRLLGDGNVVVPATCPAFTLRTAYEGASSRFRVFDEAGALAGSLVTLRAGKRLKVDLITVEQKYRRCKLATRMYEAAATYACRHGHALQSDTLRSVASHAFWAKQAAKGRAKCAKRASAFEAPRNDGPHYGRGGCDYYRLTTCATPVDLSGRTRRR
jgi:GNAT superfamily N-acetyltransferase